MLTNYQVSAIVFVLCFVTILEGTLFGIAFMDNNDHLKVKYNDLEQDPIFSDNMPTFVVLDQVLD